MDQLNVEVHEDGNIRRVLVTFVPTVADDTEDEAVIPTRLGY
jgi:hypothetical protein